MTLVDQSPRGLKSSLDVLSFSSFASFLCLLAAYVLGLFGYYDVSNMMFNLGGTVFLISSVAWIFSAAFVLAVYREKSFRVLRGAPFVLIPVSVVAIIYAVVVVFYNR